MSHLERALEWLRPLILGSNIWDYCVLWKLGDDPSRFIELVDCCCNGGGIQKMGLKRVKREHNVAIPLCRDAFHVHQKNTKACEALSRLPPSLPLYYGLHGEVVISGQTKWVNIARTSNSSSSNEDFFQTQVLIPILGGLIELFSTYNIPEDQRIIEQMKSLFAIDPETETLSTSTISFDGHPNYPSLNQSSILPLTRITGGHQNSHPNFDGSTTNSFPSDEHTSPDSNPCSVAQSLPVNLSGPNHKDEGIPKKENKSKNLFTERRRRSRINEGMLMLRSLVPNITKMNRAATLGDAIDYIDVLKKQIDKLKLEHTDMEEPDNNKDVSKLKVSDLKGEVRKRPNLMAQIVRACQLSPGEFSLEIKCQQIPGAFTRLLEALGSSDLHVCEVKSANVTTCNDLMWSILTVQTLGKQIQVKDLMETLTASMTA